jgi:hypothetical protein
VRVSRLDDERHLCEAHRFLQKVIAPEATHARELLAEAHLAIGKRDSAISSSKPLEWHSTGWARGWTGGTAVPES